MYIYIYIYTCNYMPLLHLAPMRNAQIPNACEATRFDKATKEAARRAGRRLYTVPHQGHAPTMRRCMFDIIVHAHRVHVDV